MEVLTSPSTSIPGVPCGPRPGLVGRGGVARRSLSALAIARLPATVLGIDGFGVRL